MSMNQEVNQVKCVVVGDGAVGKTCMMISYTENHFPVSYVPTVFDNYEALINVNGKEVNFSLWDTAGQEGYARIRSLSYPKTDVFLLCFSVAHHYSFDNVTENWLVELRHHCPQAPIILVGTKSDLRESPKALEELQKTGLKLVTTEEAQQLATKIKAVKYMECSALTRKGLKDVFDTALTTVVMREQHQTHLNSSSKPSFRNNKKGCLLF